MRRIRISTTSGSGGLVSCPAKVKLQEGVLMEYGVLDWHTVVESERFRAEIKVNSNIMERSLRSY